MQTLTDLAMLGKKVLVRVDFNVPMQDGAVTDDTRLRAAASTIKTLVAGGAKVILLSHFGRPDGKRDMAYSLKPLLPVLQQIVGLPKIAFADDCVGAVAEQAAGALQNGEVLLLENLRFHAEEEKNTPAFADALARLGEVFINDAFSVSHRAHASTVGLPERLPSYAGHLLAAEIKALTTTIDRAVPPAAAIIGGAKVSSKVAVLENLLAKVSLLIIGGGMANTFLAAQGLDVAASFYDKESAPIATRIMQQATAAGKKIILPIDAVVATKLAPRIPTTTVPVNAVPAGMMILDIGAQTVALIKRELSQCRTVVWNGPLGVFETPPFDAGTTAVAQVVADLTRTGQVTSVAGGGDTVAALQHAGVTETLSYVSTAGGAFLEWLEGKHLPGVAALNQAPYRTSRPAA